VDEGPRVSRPLLFRSSSFRLALIQGAVFALIVALLFGVTWWAIAAYVERQVHVAARDELQELASAIGSPGQDEATSRAGAFQHGVGEFVGFFDAGGHWLAGDFAVLPEIEGDLQIRMRRADGSLTSSMNVHVVRERSAAGQWLVAGVSRRDADALLARVGRAFLGAGLLGLLAALVAGFVTSRRYLRRVEAIADAASRIVEGRLETRLALGTRGDEIDRLSESLNAMWARIEALLAGMKQVSTDIAHELRTPLAHLRFRLERAMAAAGDEGAVRQAIDASLLDVDRVLAVFAALLRIAQIQSRDRQAGFSRIDLSQLVDATVGDYQPLFEDEGRVLVSQVEPALVIVGDRTLLAQLLVNLFENILRHTAKGTSAELTLQRLGEGVELKVSDAGPGIDEHERERVLHRLVRLDPARGGSGAGLGLALVKAIADLHEARLDLADARPGLCIRIRFAGSMLTDR